MHCNYCGVFISRDDVVRNQTVGFTTENESGEVEELDVFTASASCLCGSTTQYQLTYVNEDIDVMGDILPE